MKLTRQSNPQSERLRLSFGREYDAVLADFRLEADRLSLMPREQSQDLLARWDRIQAGLVDDPRSAVADADQLVAHVIRSLTETFGRERAALDQEWNKGEQVSTEELRVALQHYRAFFQRLLCV